MFEFTYQGIKQELLIDGCFEPNLTTNIMLSAAIKELTENKNKFKRIIEIGCGCGVISSFLLKQGFFDMINYLGVSDLSKQAVLVSKKNIQNSGSPNNFQNINYKVGPGLLPWKDYQFDFVINDISAISDAIVPMNSWFSNAPNNAGIEGISNTITVLNEFRSIGKIGSTMIFPVLSLSNTEILFKEIKKLGFNHDEVKKQSWPLPTNMVQMHKDRLFELRDLKYIDFNEKFGQLIVETICYKVVI